MHAQGEPDPLHVHDAPIAIDLPREPSAVGAARRWLATNLEHTGVLGDDARDLVLLMASELITNVIRHTTSLPHLAVRDEAGGVRVDVHDDDPTIPHALAQEPHRVGGNGLLIVSSFSDQWGVDPIPDDGKVVWFTAGTGPDTTVTT